MSGLPVSHTPSNVSGANLTRTNLHRDMRFFDLMPPLIREQLHAAPHNYCAEQVLRAWQASGLTDGQFVRRVMQPKFENDRNIKQ